MTLQSPSSPLTTLPRVFCQLRLCRRISIVAECPRIQTPHVILGTKLVGRSGCQNMATDCMKLLGLSEWAPGCRFLYEYWSAPASVTPSLQPISYHLFCYYNCHCQPKLLQFSISLRKVCEGYTADSCRGGYIKTLCSVCGLITLCTPLTGSSHLFVCIDFSFAIMGKLSRK